MSRSPVVSRRRFLGTAAAAVAWPHWSAAAKDSFDPPQAAAAADVRVLHPRGRVPVSFIIDDSTCLVNMGHFCMPQFAEAWPDRAEYHKPWPTWPREIPDEFVREFGEWCAGQGVKGKYSIVPFPACVGWLDRELPGWPRRALTDSLDLVRTLLLPNWDIHPEMITHTRVIDLATGRPFEEISAATMENSYPQEPRSVDELAAYLAYALRILKNCGLPCEGITTPGGFGNRVKQELSQAVQEAVRDVFAAEIPHYFKYVRDAGESTLPVLEHVRGRDTDDVRLTVNVVAGTGDWFGGWDGDLAPQPDRYATADGSAGRLIDLIEAGEPAVFLCHWPGLYSHGMKTGFRAFQQVVTAVNTRYRDTIHWMKLSEIARYQAARELTTIASVSGVTTLQGPFACPDFTVDLTLPPTHVPQVSVAGTPVALVEARQRTDLASGRFHRGSERTTICFGLPRREAVTIGSATGS